MFCATRLLLNRIGAIVTGFHKTRASTTAIPQKLKGIQKVLVANRGEIACRVIATAHRLAVFSSVDAKAKHVQLADEACRIGDAPAAASYLNAAAILDAATKYGATAIHPGYGFLSEDYRFAEQCKNIGINLIGPPGSVMRQMGDKSMAKQIMRRAGVPVVPGYDGDNQDLDWLVEQGNTVGYPVLVKATMGGGGKGMKLAFNSHELKDAIASAQREALSSFGDDRILLERFIQKPRHIEVQIMADTHGNVIHLFERDCSIQRRHQKVIEESPAPLITNDFRTAICESAVSAAKAVGYTNAGTVEFILDTESNEYFFMEMNTRLQVEHPVTEAVCGLDLVELQFKVASGEEMTLKQDDVRLMGHAIEARVYAELPHQGFLPSAGRVERWKLPQNGIEFRIPEDNEARIDSGVAAGDDVGVYYDPMIAKVICKGQTRNDAIVALETALGQLQVSGVPTNLEFLQRILNHERFISAALSTNFIADNEKALLGHHEIPSELFALTTAIRFRIQQSLSAEQCGHLLGPWREGRSLRLNHQYENQISLSSNEGVTVNVWMQIDQSGNAKIDLGSKRITVDNLEVTEDRFQSEVNGILCHGHCCLFKRSRDVGISVWSSLGNCTLFSPLQDTAHEATISHGSGTITAPMHGKVVKVAVSNGDTVSVGDILVVIEAMKMEHAIKATQNGVVGNISVVDGARVHDGQQMMTINVEDSNP